MCILIIRGEGNPAPFMEVRTCAMLLTSPSSNRKRKSKKKNWKGEMKTKMSDVQVLRELMAHMTPRPWSYTSPCSNGGALLRMGPPDGNPTGYQQLQVAPAGNAAGIVALRNAVPAFLDELEAARAELAELRGRMAEFRAWVQFYADADLARFIKGRRDTSFWLNPQVVMEQIKAWAAKEAPDA
jgi:hypothetical protein